MNKIPFLCSVLFLLTFFSIFLLPLGMSIDSEIMDRFWHSRWNDRIDLLYMIGSFASGANVSLVAKNGTKQPWVKIDNSRNFDRDFALFRVKIWLWLSYNLFLRYDSKILHKKFEVISTKNEGVTVIFPNFDFILNRKNKRHAFSFARNDLKFFV